jgi:hypothetical protein
MATDNTVTLIGNLTDNPELDTLFGRGLVRTWTDDLAGARQDLAGVLAAAHNQSVAFRLLVATMLGQAEYRLGCWDDAVVHCDLAISAADADQTGFAGPLYHAVACLVRAARGQWGPATAHAEAAQLGAVPGHLGYSVSSWPGSSLSTYLDGRASSGDGATPRRWRSDDTWTWRAWRAVGGGADPHRPSIRSPVETTSPALTASAASSVRSMPLPTPADDPSRRPSSTGPRSRTSANGDDAAWLRPSRDPALSEP